MLDKKAIRSRFRSSVFKRDKYTCQVCGKRWSEQDVDPTLQRINAHHITDRSHFPYGGYVKENGITVCETPCHLQVEQYHITGTSIQGLSPEDLYQKIGSSRDIAFKKDAHNG